MWALKARGLLLLSLVLLVACGTLQRDRDREGAELEGRSAEQQRRQTGGVSQSPLHAQPRSATDARYADDPWNDPNNPLSNRTIYFLYDSVEVQPQYRPVITTHAKFLAANPRLSVVLEGHADEQGTREYNIALGEQRAKAVSKVLKLQGVGDGQLQRVSYGEEKPAKAGHDEASWRLNRRVEIVYPGQR